MKIALSGSGSTGKTTLANCINKELNIPIINEYAREIAKEMGIKNIRQIQPHESYEFQTRILQKKIEQETEYETFIADRSLADAMAYYLRWCSRDIDDEKNKIYVDTCAEHLYTYDKIILLPWNGIPLNDDGFRSAKLYYQYEIHCLIKGILQDYSIEYDILTKSDLNERINYVKSLYI